MKIRHLLASVATLLALANSASAVEVKPLHGQSIDLGGVTGTAYYSVEQAGYRVVATLARDGGGAPPVRVEAVLAPGQSVSLSTPREWGYEVEAVEIQRIDDRLFVQKAPLTH
ncbi:hypothetical protein [Methylocella sp.]|uniref:hypothetical protein n=1 Tax=Methylocella sp. TaxID=1978226 RepID=UPI0035B3C578